jgi:hypothetical protein
MIVRPPGRSSLHQLYPGVEFSKPRRRLAKIHLPKSDGDGSDLWISEKRADGAEENGFPRQLQKRLPSTTHAGTRPGGGHGDSNGRVSSVFFFFGNVQGRPAVLRRDLRAWDPCRLPRAPGT